MPRSASTRVETAWLRRVHARGALIATVCTGSVLLAESGLLDGRSCACHWAYGPLFRQAYPRVRFRPEQVLELAHEADGLITGGGVTSWQDLVLYLIARYCGPAHAAETAKVFLLDRHADGQLPYSAMTRVVRGDDAASAVRSTWIDGHYAVANPVSAMARRGRPACRGRSPGGSSTATGRKPIEHVHALRVEAARHLLEAGAAGGRRHRVRGGLRGPDVLPAPVPADDGDDARRVPAEVRRDGGGRAGELAVG